MNTKWIIFALSMLMLSGCGGPHWVKNADTFVDHKDGYSIDIPTEWIQYKNSILHDGLYFSKDGPAINYIQIEQISDDDLRDKLGELPSEIMLADWINAYLAYRFESATYKKISEGPALIGIKKQPGFFIDLRIPGSKSLPIRIKSYVLRGSEGLIVLEYYAPELYYFERDLGIFETVSSTFQK